MTEKNNTTIHGVSRSDVCTVWCGGCGSWFAGEATRLIDGDAEPEKLAAFSKSGLSTLNKVVCGSCSWTYVIEEWVAVTFPSSEEMFLVVPETHRHRAQSIRQDFIRKMTSAPGAVIPPYVIEPVMVAGHHELAELKSKTAQPESQRPIEAVSINQSPEPEDEPTGQDLVRRKAQSLDLLAELLSDDESDISSRGPGLLDGEDTWAVSAANEGDSEKAGVIPITDGEYDSPQDQEWSAPRHTDSINLDALLNEPTGEHDVLTSAAPMAVKPVDDSRAFESDLADQIESDMTPEQLDDVTGSVEIDAVLQHEESATDKPSSSLNIIEPSVRLTGSVEIPAVEASVENIESDRASPVADTKTSVILDSERTETAASPAPADVLSLNDEQVIVSWTASSAQALALGALRTQLYFQVHRVSDGVAFALTVRFMAAEAGEPTQSPLVRAIHPSQPETRRCLDALAESFSVLVRITDDDGHSTERVFSPPLEDNIRNALTLVDEVTVDASDAISETGYGLFGTVSHSFVEDSFHTLTTAAEANLAKGIVEFWSQPDNRRQLLEILSFPVTWWNQMTERVANAALQFGLAAGGELRRAMRAAAHLEEVELVQQLVANFSEVSLNLRANELDPLDEWANWDQLLAWAETHGIAVDEQVEEIAQRALRAAERVVAQEGGSENDASMFEAIEVSLADAIDIASIGASNVQDYMDLSGDDGKPVIQPAMADMGDDELLGALDDSDRRAGACVQLLNRAPAEHSSVVFDCVMQMDGPELAIVIPSILPVASSFVPLFRNALFADKPTHRLSAAMLLAEVGDERSLNPILAMMLDPEESQWRLLAEAAARLGPIVIQPALSRAAVDESGTERITALLGYVGAVNPDALSDVAERYDDPALGACISRAQELAVGLNRPETPPFAFRLTALLDAAQPRSK